MRIYNPDEQKVLLAKFSSSEQMIADNAGKETSHLEDFYRVKTYVKPKDMLRADYPVFPQPYQLGQSLFGGTWNDYNSVFVVQVADCNLDCWYCFVPKQLRSGLEVSPEGVQLGEWFTADEIMEMWMESGAKVLRISGGEPTLASDLLAQMIDKMEDEQAILWIDTNLSTGDMFSKAYNASVASLDYHPNVALSGCFKGFCEGDAATATRVGGGLLTVQFFTAADIIRNTDVEMYFYVPGIFSKDMTNPERCIKDFFDRMREEVDEHAPLRTYILEVKDYSSTQVDEWDNWATRLPTGGRPVDYWQELCEIHYSPELLWLPNNQIDFKVRQ